VALAGVIAGLAALASALGLFLTGGPGRHDVTTARGATATVYGEGLYADDTLLVGTGNRGTDAANLLVEIPLLVVAVVAYRRGSLRGRLLLAGVLAYFLYYYTSMVFATAQNRLFPAYIALMGASLFAFVALVASIDARWVADAYPGRPSRRVLAGYQLAVAGALSAAWAPGLVAATVTGEIAEVVEVYTSAVTTALDLGVVAPLAVVSALSLLRRRPVGYLTSAVLLVLNVAIGTALLAQVVAQVLVGVPLTAGEIVGKSLTFLALTVVAGGLIAALLRHARVTRGARPPSRP
jgi:hypothetical protein